MGRLRSPLFRALFTKAAQVNDRSAWRRCRAVQKSATPPLLPTRFSTYNIRASRSDNSSPASRPMQHSDSASAGSWLGHQGAAAFDFRSDTMTTPTSAMLLAIQKTTLLDDVFEEDPTTIDLEAHVASLTGKEAGLFVLSGTMGNQIALRSLLRQPPYGVLCDHRSHIVKYEAGGVSSLTGAMVSTVAPKNATYLTLEDIQSKAVLGDEVHSCPTCVISLENSLNGLIIPLAEVKRISEFAREHGIMMHCDGARLWEVVAAGAGSLRDFCQYFDTVSLCFSKGLGAPIGSILVGSKSLIKHARWVRKSIGGGLRQSGVVTAAARVAVDVTFGKGPDGEGGLLRDTHATAKRVEKLWTGLGGRMECPVQTNMCWLDLKSMNCSVSRFVELGNQVGLKLMGNRLITHYQIGEEAIQRLSGIFETISREKEGPEYKTDSQTHQYGPYGV
ncbi:pyridoxal phosphate-dependent transferase [Durotheca rogersii]|uniref:pyridoxal phosphate-dependent transferase n=1 Tax=Durotheca rogersii TaxID=419775 RepID=UPI002220445D|nr:pyridoxal phosphate-dependent transferase [Durotheca rogersii]KAI5864970.1 pyridoxal phosphate-dependent transferase [Durotheca rogersii]